MGTEVININVDVLQERLDKAKSNLKGLNDNIRRISGRDPPDQLRGDRKRSFDRRTDRGGEFTDNRNRNNRGDSPPQKRKPETKSVFSRLSGPPPNRDDDLKPKINSRIIRELPTKQEIVEAQGSDPASRARNRRMFGSLLGTLQKFCQEESRLKQKEEKKAQIEKKLEEQEIQEREHMKKERQNLYINRKRQQLEIKMLEQKMNRMREFATWEESKKPLMNFIRTKAKPRIYYLPKVLDKKTQRRLEECRRDIEKQIEKRRAEVNEELAEIVSRFETATEQLQTSSNDSNASNNHKNDGDEKYKDASEKHDRRQSHNDEFDDESNHENDDNRNVDEAEHTDDDYEDVRMSEISIKVEKDDEESKPSSTNDKNTKPTLDSVAITQKTSQRNDESHPESSKI